MRHSLLVLCFLVVIGVLGCGGETAPTDPSYFVTDPVDTCGNAVWSILDSGAITGRANAIHRSDSGVLLVGGSYDTLWNIRRSDDLGASWTTVDAGEIATHHSASPEAFLSADGKIFAFGTGHEGSGFSLVVRSSSDDGMTWSEEHYSSAFGSGGTKLFEAKSLASGSIVALALVVRITGLEFDPTVDIVRLERSAGSGTWTRSNEVSFKNIRYRYGFTGGLFTSSGSTLLTGVFESKWSLFTPTGAASAPSLVDTLADASQGLFLLPIGESRFLSFGTWGMSSSVDSPLVWRTRASSDSGATWNYVDGVAFSDGSAALPTTVFSAPDDTLFAGGASESSTRRRWIVRRSSDGGAIWSAFVSTDLAAGFPGGTRGLGPRAGLATDPSTLFLVGADLDDDHTRWVVRKVVCPVP